VTVFTGNGESGRPLSFTGLDIWGGELVKVDWRVGRDTWTSVRKTSVNGAILTCGDSGQMDHIEIIASHELNSHIFPICRRIRVSCPVNETVLAGRICVSGWLVGEYFSSDDERSNGNE